MCSYRPNIRHRFRFELVGVGFEGFSAVAGVVLPQGFAEGGLLSGLLGEQPNLDGAKFPGDRRLDYGAITHAERCHILYLETRKAHDKLSPGDAADLESNIYAKKLRKIHDGQPWKGEQVR